MSKIEWTENSINPLTTTEGGWFCEKASIGCQNCYAEKTNLRFGNKRYYESNQGKTNPPQFSLNRSMLSRISKWKTPKKIFVQSMSDLFLPGHDFVKDGALWRSWFEALRQIWLTIRHHEKHTFIVLTKHPQRMFDFHKWIIDKYPSYGFAYDNLWLGVSAENQEQADKRIPILLQVPAKVRFVSVEPMLSNINLTKICLEKSNGGLNGIKPDITIDVLSGWHGGENRPDKTKLDWVICGGESGQKARPMHPDWVRSLRDQCINAEVPFFFKQWGEWLPSVVPRTEHHGKTQSCILSVDGFRRDNPSWERGAMTQGPDWLFYKVGKKTACSLLDGQTWEQLPLWK